MSHHTQRTTLSITRRGRMVISTIVAASVIALGLLVAGPGAQAGGETATQAPTYTVLAGETLWSIATQVAPHQDPRVTIDQLTRANNLRGAAIAPGDVLLLPSGF